MRIVRAGRRIRRAAPASTAPSGDAGDMMGGLAGAVPHIDLRGELRRLVEIRERLVNAGDEENSCHRATAARADDGGLADGV